MKKLIFSLMVFSFVCVYAQEFQFPGSSCRDVALLQEQLPLAPSVGYRILLTYQLDFAMNGEPATFAEACTRIETICRSVQPDSTPGYIRNRQKQYAHHNNVFPDELVTFCKENPGDYDFYVALRTADGDWAFELLSLILVEGKRSAKDTGQALEKVNSLGVKLGKDNATMLALLSDCNRIYTGKLLEDKEKWADIVAQIRTLMELYK